MILSRLRDPGSAQLQWGKASRDAIQESFASPNPVLVWVTTVDVNAKNGFGGYVGFKPYSFAWRNGKLYAFAHEDTLGWSFVQ